MNILEEFLKLDKKSEIRIGVIGDAMIDEYFSVSVKKISPEFPIPVMHSDNDFPIEFPGGAANVAYQFKHFNVNCSLMSFIDKGADVSFSLKGLNTALCLDIDGKIPRKRRFYSDNFPTYRWDVEKHHYGLGPDLDKKCFKLYEKAKRICDTFNVVIFSDYDKGVFYNYTNKIIAESTISIVDPKCGDLDRWRGCTVFKPNLKEAHEFTGEKTVKEAGLQLLERLQCEAVIITQAGDGVTVFEQGNICEIKPTQKITAAESVIGAGDCFTAFLAMAMGRGMRVCQAAEVAFQVGTLYVRNRHNKPISSEDIVRQYDPTVSKVIADPLEYFRTRDYKLIMTNGCFDIMHAGHLELLKYAKSLGDKLVVAVNTDSSVTSIKPGRPFVTLKDRVKMLSALEFVDYVVTFNESTPLSIIKDIKPDVLVKGAEYEKEKVVGYGIVEVVLAPMVEGLSTTKLIEKIKAS